MLMFNGLSHPHVSVREITCYSTCFRDCESVVSIGIQHNPWLTSYKAALPSEPDQAITRSQSANLEQDRRQHDEMRVHSPWQPDNPRNELQTLTQPVETTRSESIQMIDLTTPTAPIRTPENQSSSNATTAEVSPPPEKKRRIGQDGPSQEQLPYVIVSTVQDNKIIERIGAKLQDGRVQFMRKEDGSDQWRKMYWFKRNRAEEHRTLEPGQTLPNHWKPWIVEPLVQSKSERPNGWYVGHAAKDPVELEKNSMFLTYLLSRQH